MITAHLPAGFLYTSALGKRFKLGKWLWVGLVASILPDFDLAYSWFIDTAHTPHHYYWTHYPLVWLGLWLLTLAACLAFRRKRFALMASAVFFGNIFLHLLLDTLVGNIYWLAPFSFVPLRVLHIPAVHTYWFEDYFFHWTIVFELAIDAAGSILLLDKLGLRAVEYKKTAL